MGLLSELWRIKNRQQYALIIEIRTETSVEIIRFFVQFPITN